MLKQKANGIGRREFLVGAGLGLSGVAFAGLSACSPPSDGNADESKGASVQWAETYDVIIVGGGGAGLSAAIEAKNNGASVVVFDCEPTFGLSGTSLSGAVVMACGTSQQKERGYEDTLENFKKYIDADTTELGDLDLLYDWAEKSKGTLEWLEELGVEFPAENLYMSGREQFFDNITPAVPRGHTTEGHTGADITSVLHATCEENGIVLNYSDEVIDLYKDDQGRIIGVAAHSGNYEANKGVILCAAGFSRNNEMVKDFIPAFVGGGSFGSSRQQGDGIRMGALAGAALHRMWGLQTNNVALVKDENNSVGGYWQNGWSNPYIYINEEGKRLVAEDMFYEDVFDIVGAQPSRFIWSLWDEFATSSDTVGSPGSYSKGLEKEIATGAICKADTLDEIASFMNVDPTVLKETVSRYNEMMDAGVDTDFNRVNGVGPEGKIDQPPYYAGKMVTATVDTAGGMKIDFKTGKVLDWNDEPIEGLWAAGTNVGGWRGKYYLGSGLSVSYAITSGRTAGVDITT